MEAKQISGMQLMPCAPDVCQECAVKHEKGNAHNNQSLYYQYHFYAEHKRFPTWKDAIAHCSEEVKKAWEVELRKIGQWKD
jgi:hypothetical protein